ncbi:FAD-dependent oxidoreductase [Ideonella sp. DXS29W]|uniref:FAD-dependent oxidoreductase n=1 Tax=Ideonella lacteola TaxID=2984193 RepID=A0ABU9BVW3_9BURK
MLSTYRYPTFAYQRPPELDASSVARRPVVVVGAGPVGLTAAIDLAQRGVPVLLFDDDDTVSIGSRGVCYAKRTLEVLDRLGCGQAMVDKGVTWNVGRTFFDTQEVFHFNLLPEAGHERPGMINLQQYYLEEFLVRRAEQLPGLELRWKHRVSQVEPQRDGVRLQVETADGGFTMEADWLVVADGARSPIRRQLGLDIEGQVFHDRFLIADVVMQADFPAERWFWFDPPFHRGQSVLLHKQADRVWRIDFQLGWNADPEEEKKPERVIPRIQAMLSQHRGADDQPATACPEFELEWVSVYTFQCRRMPQFRHGRVLFVGDAAHQVSPFGARGANSGIQDADNLGWKLHAVIQGAAPEALLDSYAHERGRAADENILNSTRSTDFITPKSATSKLFRDAVLGLARDHAFARALVNSGRLSVPTLALDSPLNTPDDSGFGGGLRPGAPMDDAPVLIEGRSAWLLREVANRSDGFVLLLFGDEPPPDWSAWPESPVPLRLVQVSARPRPGALVDAEGLAARRYDAQPGTCYLIRPDQHVAARWRRFDSAAVAAALSRALQRAPAVV